MVLFDKMVPSEHYLAHHADFPWARVVEIILTTKNVYSLR